MPSGDSLRNRGWEERFLVQTSEASPGFLFALLSISVWKKHWPSSLSNATSEDSESPFPTHPLNPVRLQHMRKLWKWHKAGIEWLVVLEKVRAWEPLGKSHGETSKVWLFTLLYVKSWAAILSQPNFCLFEAFNTLNAAESSSEVFDTGNPNIGGAQSQNHDLRKIVLLAPGFCDSLRLPVYTFILQQLSICPEDQLESKFVIPYFFLPKFLHCFYLPPVHFSFYQYLTRVIFLVDIHYLYLLMEYSILIWHMYHV